MTPPLPDLLTRIRRIASAYRSPLTEELEGAGNLALAECLAGFDGRGDFWQWSVVRIRGAMVDELRWWSQGTRHGRSVYRDTASLDAPLGLDSDLTLGDTIAAPARDLDAALDICAALSRVPPRPRAVFLRHALLGESLADIGRDWGVDRSRTCQLMGVARRQLQEAIA
jgi:RNA polymerase sigma factor (sigma-70 family)